MEPILIDGEWLVMTVPDGFEAMPQDELEAIMGFKYDQMRGIHDTTRHMVVSVTWKDSNKLLTKMVGEKSYSRQVDKAFAKRYRKGGYRCNGFFERTVSGAPSTAHGLRFSCSIAGVPREGEVLVFKRGIRCYTLCYFSYASDAEANRPVFEEIIASLEVR